MRVLEAVPIIFSDLKFMAIEYIKQHIALIGERLSESSLFLKICMLGVILSNSELFRNFVLEMLDYCGNI